jgi:hypothetical protein
MDSKKIEACLALRGDKVTEEDSLLDHENILATLFAEFELGFIKII